jgi:hypothetical protein
MSCVEWLQINELNGYRRKLLWSDLSSYLRIFLDDLATMTEAQGRESRPDVLSSPVKETKEYQRDHHYPRWWGSESNVALTTLNFLLSSSSEQWYWKSGVIIWNNNHYPTNAWKLLCVLWSVCKLYSLLSFKLWTNISRAAVGTAQHKEWSLSVIICGYSPRKPDQSLSLPDLITQ